MIVYRPTVNDCVLIKILLFFWAAHHHLGRHTIIDVANTQSLIFNRTHSLSLDTHPSPIVRTYGHHSCLLFCNNTVLHFKAHLSPRVTKSRRAAEFSLHLKWDPPPCGEGKLFLGFDLSVTQWVGVAHSISVTWRFFPGPRAWRNGWRDENHNFRPTCFLDAPFNTRSQFW